MATLDEIRHDITQLDQELLALLAKRKTPGRGNPL